MDTEDPPAAPLATGVFADGEDEDWQGLSMQLDRALAQAHSEAVQQGVRAQVCGGGTVICHRCMVRWSSFAALEFMIALGVAWRHIANWASCLMPSQQLPLVSRLVRLGSLLVGVAARMAVGLHPGALARPCLRWTAPGTQLQPGSRASGS